MTENRIGKDATKAAARAGRGETSPTYDEQFATLSDRQLIALLCEVDPQKRTSAAKHLGRRKCSEAIPLLCEQLRKENALYARIAITEALGAMGEPALSALAPLLGRIGGNQHREPPGKGFRKRGYPLPRDIVARTIAKMGRQALRTLEKVVLEADRGSASEAIDAIGYIACHENDRTPEGVLLEAYEKYRADRLVRWKLIRSFQAFPTDTVRSLLIAVVGNSPYPEQRWEAVRSLALTGSKIPLGDELSLDAVSRAREDENAEVRDIAGFFLSRPPAGVRKDGGREGHRP